MVRRPARSLSEGEYTDRLTTYEIACVHASPSRLYTAALVLKTRDMSQKALVAVLSLVVEGPQVSCIMDAVTPEKKVATVDRLSRMDTE